MANPQFFFALRGEDTDTLELDVYDVIGEDWWGDGVSAKNVRAKLKAFKGGTIKLRVNSPGGDVIDGFAIYNLLNEHPARVEVDIDALAASMASVVVMAADEIRMAPNALVMIHNPWGVGIGEADDLRAHADLLDKMRSQIADAYVARTGQTKAKVLQMMDAETWLTAAEAKELGFTDKVKAAKKGKSSAQARAFASLNLSGFESVPNALKLAVERAREEISGSANGRDQTDEDKGTNMDELKTVLATLGVASVAEGAERLARLSRIEAATSVTGDEAHGLIMAALASHAELPTARARIAELEKQAEAHLLDALIAKAKDEKKITPAIEQSVRAQFGAGEITLKGAEAWLSNLTAIGAFAQRQPAAGGPSGAPGALAWNGKTWAELKPRERAELAKADPELFAAMRSAS